MQDLSRKHQDLASTISGKQELMSELIKQKEHNFYLQRQYETKIGSMEKEIARITREKDNSNSTNTQDSEQKRKMRERNDQKVSALKKQISSFRGKLLENQRMKRALLHVCIFRVVRAIRVIRVIYVYIYIYIYCIC